MSLTLAVVAISLSLLSVVNAPRLSALDEITHIDYAYRLAHGSVPYTGEPLTRYTLDSWSCRGQAGLALPPCDSGLPNSKFPGGAVQYNGFHPPLYYALTGYAARALSAMTGKDFVTVARSLGALWLLAGTLGLYFALRYWRVGWRWAFGGALLLPLFPSVLEASSTVTNDAPAMLAGVAVLFLLGRSVIYHRNGWLLPVLLTALATATKSITGVGMLATAFVLLILGVARWRAGKSKTDLLLIRNAVLMFASFGIVHLTWQFIQEHRVPTGYVSPIDGVHTAKIVGLPFDEWLPTLVSGTRLGANFYLDPAVSNQYLLAWIIFLSTVMSAVCFLGIAMFRRFTPRWLAGATLLAGVIIYPLCVQGQALLGGTYFPSMNDRYGMSLLPLAVAVLVMVLERKKMRVTAAIGLVVGGVAMLSAVLGLQ